MDPSAFNIRRVTSSDDDLRSIVTVMELLDRGPGSIKDLRDLRARMRQVLHIVACADDQPVGFGFAGTWPGGEFYPRLEALIGVGPTHRRRGIGSALFRTLSDHARDLGKTGFQFEMFEDRADALAFLLNRAYTEVGRELQFEMDLVDAAPPSWEPPAGIEIVTRAQRPDLVRGMYEVVQEAGPDIPGSQGEGPGSFEDWYAFEIERQNHLPENCFIAVHQDEAVGFATLQVFEGDTAHHGATLVKRAYRGRGIARALALRQIEAARAAGFGRLRCETEARNEPMRRLLEQLGYGSLPSVIVLHGPLDRTSESSLKDATLQLRD